MGEPQAKSPTEITSLSAPSDRSDGSPIAVHVAAFPHDGLGKRSRRNSASSAKPVTEQTPLLKPYAHSITPSRQEDSPVQSRSVTTSYELPIRHWSLTLSFFLGSALAYLNWAFLALTALSTVHLSIAVYLPHRASTFLPIWLAFLGGTTALLHLLDFAYPKRTPQGAARVFNVAVSVLLLADLLLLTLVQELRIKEGFLTIAVAIVAFLTYLTAAIRPRLSHNPPPFFSISSIDHDHSDLSGWQKFKHGVQDVLSLLTITFPLFVVHLAILLSSFLIFLNLCLRAVDAALVPPGALSWVNPTTWQYNSTSQFIDGIAPTSQAAFRLHLNCDGGDDWEGRTILYEGPASRPGSLGAPWLHDFVRNKTSANLRLCTYDRPGYGFSDNAPTSALAFVSKALEEALDRYGEFSRVSKPGGGFVLVSDGYGGLLSRVFASRNAVHIHSMLLLDPQTDESYFSDLVPSLKRDFKFFFKDVLGSLLTPLGIRRFAAIMFSPDSTVGNRASRVYGTAANGLSSSFPRSALQQAHEAHTQSQSWFDLKESLRRFPNRPAILVSSQQRLERHHRWRDGQETLAKYILGRGIIRWDKVDAGHRVCEETAKGQEVCKQALEDLLTSKLPKV